MKENASNKVMLGTPACGLLCGLIGIVIALAFLFLGFWRTLFVAVFFAVGYAVGAYAKKPEAAEEEDFPVEEQE